MNALKSSLIASAVLFAGGCATAERAEKDTLNERSERLAHLEDRRPPNPNQPADNREQKATPSVIQAEPTPKALPAEQEGKGLVVNAGPDQHVRPQDPTQTDEAPQAVGGPAAQVQTGTVASADAALAARVKEALAKARTP